MNYSGIITLTTDFGHKGPFSAVMRGVILSRYRDARIIDLAHDIPPQWPPEAGFWISRSYRFFPLGSIHLAIVDPGVGTERHILLAQIDGHLFVAPDNGLLAQLLDHSPNAEVWRLDMNQLCRLKIGEISDTFHGRDIFSPVAAELAAGNVTIADIATPTKEWTPGWLDEPNVTRSKVTGAIITIDAFGNLISNIDAKLIAKFNRPVAQIAGRKIEMQDTYGRAHPGDFLALANSFGVIEIAKAEGNAEAALGTQRGAPLTIVEYQ